MSDPAPAPASPPRKKRGWLRRSLRWIALLAVLVAIFHRPLFHFTVRFALRLAAARAHVSLDLRTSGTIFTNLTVSGVDARPNGTGKTPIRLIKIERVRLDYSIPDLIRHGLGEFLRSYEIHHAQIEIDALPGGEETKDEQQEKFRIVKMVNDILGQPAAYSDRVTIEDFNITVHAPGNVTEVQGFNLRLDPENPGELRIARLAIPGVPVWENLHAETSYVERNLFIRHLRLAPELAIENLNFDASQRAQDKASVSLEVKAFGGTLALTLKGEKLVKGGEKLANAYNTSLTIEASDIAIDDAMTYFNVPKPPVSKLAQLSLTFSGEPEMPSTWDGKLHTRIEGIAAGSGNLDAVVLEAVIDKGRARITDARVIAGPNYVALTGQAELPASIEDLHKTDLDAQVKIDAPQLAKLTAMLPDPISGAAQGSGTVAIRAGQLTTDLDLTVQDIESNQFGVGEGNVSLNLKKDLTRGTAAPQTAEARAKAASTTVEPEPPAPFWEGLDVTVSGDFRDLRTAGITADSATIRAETHGQEVNLQQLEIVRGDNKITGSGTYELPRDLKDAAKSPADISLNVKAPTIGDFKIDVLGQPLTGTIDLDAKLKSTDGALNGTVAIDGRDFRFGGMNAESLAGQVDIADGRATTDGLVLRIDAQNKVTISGGAGLEKPNAFDLAVAVSLPELDKFSPLLESLGLKQPLSGRLALDFQGKGTASPLALDGALDLGAQKLGLGDFTTQRLEARVQFADGRAKIEKFAFEIDDVNRIAIGGNVGFEAPRSYEASVEVKLPELAKLQPLLTGFGVKDALTGALSLDWNGQGQLEPQQHSGQLDLAFKKGSFGKIELTAIELAGRYTPDSLLTQPFRVVTGPTSLGGVIEYEERRLRVRELSLTQAGTRVLSGFVTVPFDPADQKQPIPLDGRFAANINTTKLDLEKLLGSFGQKSPVEGSVTANLTAAGTMLEPFVHLKINAERLRAEAAKQFDPAALAFDLHYSNREITVASTVTQPQIQPLTIKASAPLDLEKTIQEKKLDPNLPIEATATLPASSLAFLPKVVPAVRRIDGTAALDVRVGGTVSRPDFSGGVTVQIKGARMIDENIPSVGAFDLKLAFAANVLKFDTFKGEVGGGTFNLGGSINLADMKNPVFDLRLQSDEVLVKRDDAITVRADTDVKVNGPLAAATVSGTVFIVHSRFFKEIDILPIALPGQAKPAPKSASQGPANISFPEPPLRDWKFDVVIKTRPDDPFLVRGNLANGAAAVSLKLGGTGLAPYLEGTVTIQDFAATLPFSTLKITNGFVAFSKDAPFQPSLEIQAESQIRDYLIRAYIYGTATNPQVQFSSEPPLPHSDIVSLLATGTTTSELSGNSSALASRAALLAVKQLYHKIFKRGQAPPTEKQGDGSFLDRFEIELGALDSGGAAGGGQEVTAKFKVNDQTYLIGDIGVDGTFTGSLKYLIRFR